MISQTQDETGAATKIVALSIRNLTVEQLASLGMAQFAYVKPVLMNGVVAYAIHAADGTPMALAGDRDLAVAAILEHDLTPTLVH